MKRSELRTFLRQGVEEINPVMPFGSGRITEWNSKRDNEYPGVWWESNINDSTDLLNFTLPQDEWQVRLHIGKKDAQDSLPEQYERLVDEAHEVAQKLVYIYNQALSSSPNVVMTSITKEPFIRKHADVVTGVLLSFTLTAPDTQQLC